MADARGWAAAVAGMRPLSHHHEQQQQQQQHHLHQQQQQQAIQQHHHQHQMSSYGITGCPHPGGFAPTGPIVHPTSLTRAHHPGLMFAGPGGTGGVSIGGMAPLGPLTPTPPTPPHHLYGSASIGGVGLVQNGNGSPKGASNCCPTMYQSSSMTSYCAMQQQQQQLSVDADQLATVYGGSGSSSSSSSTSSSAATTGGTPVSGGSLDPGLTDPHFDDSWRGSSIAELRRKALEHTASMSGMSGVDGGSIGQTTTAVYR